jgi:hypothetical protein
VETTAGSYKFRWSIHVPRTNAQCVQERTALSAVFECMTFIRCTDSPFFGRSEWWIGYVQTIIRDTVSLHYTDGAECTLRSYARRPKDQDLNIGRHVDPRISLFDILPHACQRIPVHRVTPVEDSLGYVKLKQKEWNVAPAHRDTVSVLFYDKPAVGVGRAQTVYSDGVQTGNQQIIDFTSPFPTAGALTRISGGLRFALWVVLMKDPPLVRLTERAHAFFAGVEAVPLGPQSMPQFQPLYHFIWSVDFSATVAGRVITPTGAGMTLVVHGIGPGIEVPTLVGPPATAAMGTEMSIEMRDLHGDL